MSDRHRLNDLLGMHIRFADGTDGDQVIDVRLAPGQRVRGLMNELEVEGLAVGRARPGTLFGYDRFPHQGPWMIRTVVRFVHRHSGYLAWSEIERIDWQARIVHARTTGLHDLTAARAPAVG